MATNDASYLKIVHIVDGEEVDITPPAVVPKPAPINPEEENHDQN